MRFRSTWMALIALALVFAAPGSAADKPAAAPAEKSAPVPLPMMKMQNLMEQTLSKDFLQGAQVVISIVEVPPNTTLERHWHPGEEFQYLLEGDADLMVDGQPKVHLEPGSVARVPYKALHTAATGEKGAKVLVFRVHREGEPVRYLEKGGSAKE